MAFCWDVRDGGGGPPVGHMLPKASGLAGSSLPELSFMGRAEDVSWEGPGKPTWAWFSQSRTGFFFFLIPSLILHVNAPIRDLRKESLKTQTRGDINSRKEYPNRGTVV